MRKFSCFIAIFMLLAVVAVSLQAQNPRMMINTSGHSAKIQNVLFTPDGRRIVSVSEDKTIRFWNAESGEMVLRLAGEIGDGWEGMLYASAISHDGTLLAVAGYPVGGEKKNYIVIIDLTTNKQVSTASGHTDVINTLAFTESGDGLLSGSNDGTIIFWRVSREKVWAAGGSLQMGFPVTCLSVNNKTQEVAVVAGGKDLQIYSIRDIKSSAPAKPKIWRKHQGELLKVTYSPDGSYLASSSFKNEIIIWRADGSVVFNIDKLKSPINALAFSHDSKIVAGLDFTGKGATWSVQSGHVFAEYRGHNNTVFSVAFLPGVQGNYIVASAGGDNNEIILWNAINGAPIRKMKGNGSAIHGLAFGIDLELYVAPSQLENGAPNFTSCFNLSTMSLSNSVDKSKISLSKLYDVNQTGENELTFPTGKVIRTNPESDGRILDYLQLGDGRVVVASDLSLKMFDKHGFLLKDFIGHSGAIRTLAVSADGRYLASGGEDQTIILWNLLESGPIPPIREVFTGSQWQQYFSSLAVDSLSRVPTRAAWEQVIKQMKLKGQRAHREVEEVLSTLGDAVIPFSTLFLSLDNEWVCWNPKGYYSCSSSGGRYFGWHINKGIHDLADFYDADQYYDILFSPEEMAHSLLTGKRVDEIIRDSGKRIFDFSKLQKPSAAFFEVEMQSSIFRREGGKVYTDALKIPMTVDVYDGGGGIKELNIYRNDKLILIDKEIHTKSYREKVTKTYELEIGNDVNVFKVKVINFQKIESKPDDFTVEYDGKAITTSVLHILSVGINKYQNEEYTLHYAQPDAKAFADKIIDKGGRIFKSIDHVEIYDEQATKENIVNGFNAIIKRAKPEDMFLFYYAGHGVLDEESDENEYYFVPSDVLKIHGDPGELAKKAISASELKSYLVQVKSQKQLILMDACHSGGAMKWLRTRAAGMDEKAIKQLARASGVAIMASSGTKQLATEFAALKHGVFTYALLEALDGKADNGDKKITVYELKSYMNERVPELSKQYGGKAQSPTYHFDGDDFPISVYE